ncbi:hypothetical protein BGX29_001394 [Mortierella sp. GBA35]|nr:hypothetical protein BGX29_001394 [Mortierella sp. GBA35]
MVTLNNSERSNDDCTNTNTNMRPREKRRKTAPSTSTINTTSSTSTSRVSTPARAAPSTPIPATIPGAEGMTAVQNSDETIMFFNPATGTTTYRCGLCPPSPVPTISLHPLTAGATNSSAIRNRSIVLRMRRTELLTAVRARVKLV